MPSLLLSVNNYIANSASNTTFRAYGTAISNAFANAGWVQASDTGQVDWTTVVANGTGNSSNILGYEIWRMNDDLANDAPCHVKFEYFTTSSYTNSPSIRITVGDNTDGVGNIVGVISTPISIRRAADSTASPCYFVGAPGYLILALFCVTAPIFFAIERLKDAGGNDTVEGINVLTSGLETTTVRTNQFSYTPGAGMGAAEASIGSFVPPNPPSTNGFVAPFFPVYFYRGVLSTPARNVVQTAGMGEVGIPLDLTFYGQTCRFIRPPLSAFTQRCSSSANVGILIRWD